MAKKVLVFIRKSTYVFGLNKSKAYEERNCEISVATAAPTAKNFGIRIKFNPMFATAPSVVLVKVFSCKFSTIKKLELPTPTNTKTEVQICIDRMVAASLY